jgi:superoxide dismutase, Cu-Zn family
MRLRRLPNQSITLARAVRPGLVILVMLGCTSAPPPTVRVPVSSQPTPAPVANRPQPASFTTASATLRDLAGARAGTATFTDTYAGVLVVATVTGVGLGPHAIHIHEVGKCDAPFTTAGPHFNPTHKQHGYRNADGPHLGDLPNFDTPPAGRLTFEFLLAGVSLKGQHALLDGDGSAIVVHSARDDYRTDPSGDSGSRIACGALVPRA